MEKLFAVLKWLSNRQFNFIEMSLAGGVAILLSQGRVLAGIGVVFIGVAISLLVEGYSSN